MAGWDVSRGIIAGIEGKMRCVSDYEVMILAAVLGVGIPELYPEPGKTDWAALGLGDYRMAR